MSIMIKGIAMPPTCQCCVFYYSAEFDDPALRAMLNNRCVLTNKYTDDPARKRNGDCPLVEIPPHGRLIDADELLWEMRKAKDFGELTAKSAMRAVQNAPTIIEAEGVKE